MKRNDEQFKAEIFRRFDDYKIKRKKRLMAAGSTALMLVLCAGLLQLPIESYLSPSAEETTRHIETTTIATTTEAITVESGKTYEHFDFGTQGSLDGDSAKETAELLAANAQSVTVTYGMGEWNFTSSDEAEAVMDYVLNNQNMDTTAEGTTTTEAATDQTYIILTATYAYDDTESVVTHYLTEPRWDFTALAAFLDELKEKDE